jgi:ABC-type phosphate/phosphonate transport system permease subunit
MMRKENTSLLPWLLVMLVMFPASFFLGVEKEGYLDVKVDVSQLSGISLWLVNLYNDERLIFAILVTLVMATVGMSIALFTDVLLKAFGLEVTKIEHHE